MIKKSLIGVSFVVVILIVLGSLSNVIGYQSVQSSFVSESPLYSLRIKRAINQHQSSNITLHYLGKGKVTLLKLPIRNSRIELLKKSIEIISKMDNKTFKRFIELCIQRIRQNNTFSETTPNEISQILHQLRTKPETIINSFSTNYKTPESSPPTLNNWFLGCFLIYIFGTIISILLLMSVLTGICNLPSSACHII